MITRKDLDLGMFGTGGADMTGEWIWSGNYYMYLYRNTDKLNHNYYIQFWRRGSIRKTNGWNYSVSLSLSASNSGEITICNGKERSLKKCKDKIFGWIAHYENSDAIEIEEWKNNRRNPVFVIEDGEPKIVTHTYQYASYDFEDKGHFSYWKDQKYDYKSQTPYYTITKSWSGKEDYLYLYRSTRSYCGYSSGGADFTKEEEKEIIKKVFLMVERNPMYKEFVSKYKELI